MTLSEVKPEKRLTLQEIEERQAQKQKLTLGQHVADKMAAKVGSWGFLIGQSTVLAGWIACNTVPGLPHWDEQPFILLNLVFSFASAYTAPIVLMSQNRQSDAEREKAEYDRLVNLKAGYDIELLHEKIDAMQARQNEELKAIAQENRHQWQEIRSTVLPIWQQGEINILPTMQQPTSLNEIKLSDARFPQSYSIYLPNGDRPSGHSSDATD